MHFLQELVQDYLILAHPQADLPQIEHAEEITHGDKEEDSFSQYYSSDIPKDKEKKKAAVKLKGEKLVHSDMHVTEVALSVKDIHRKARSCGVSITVLLTAMMLLFYSGRDSKESAETTGSIDDSGESEKLFSVSVYDKFLWMD